MFLSSAIIRGQINILSFFFFYKYNNFSYKILFAAQLTTFFVQRSNAKQAQSPFGGLSREVAVWTVRTREAFSAHCLFSQEATQLAQSQIRREIVSRKLTKTILIPRSNLWFPWQDHHHHLLLLHYPTLTQCFRSLHWRRAMEGLMATVLGLFLLSIYHLHISPKGLQSSLAWAHFYSMVKRERVRNDSGWFSEVGNLGDFWF